jgi:hypothetical protein
MTWSRDVELVRTLLTGVQNHCHPSRRVCADGDPLFVNNNEAGLEKEEQTERVAP